jgi:hydrogenase expression/formation protein HypE
VVAVVEASQANDVLMRCRDHRQHQNEGRIHMALESELGGERMPEELEDDSLPRLC